MIVDPLICREPALARLTLCRDDVLAVDGPIIAVAPIPSPRARSICDMSSAPEPTPSNVGRARVLVGERVDAVLVAFVGDDADLVDEPVPTIDPPPRRVIVRRPFFDRVLDGVQWICARLDEHRRKRDAAIARGLPSA